VERKVLAAIQRRIGPDMIGPFGLLQAIADAGKLIFREVLIPTKANSILFILAPIIILALSLGTWAPIFLGNKSFLDINLGILYLFTLSSLSVYSLILAGWASNSRYAFLGGIRSAAQMLSYDISLGLILLTVGLCVHSLNIGYITRAQQEIWFIFPFLPSAILFFISAIAETNRPPFDLPEAEGELVAGFNVEYSGIIFAFFFIAEYANIILMSVLFTCLFLGGPAPFPLEFFWQTVLFVLPILSVLNVGPTFLILREFSNLMEGPFFVFKVVLISLIFIWVRASFPRYRYDQLMRLGWKIILPLSLGLFIFTLCLMLTSFLI
jgi:NADH-quinone oxidoreductase subunit H